MAFDLPIDVGNGDGGHAALHNAVNDAVNLLEELVGPPGGTGRTSDSLGFVAEGPTSHQRWMVRARHVGGLNFPVPAFAPDGPNDNYNLAFDLFPKGLPGTFTTNGVVWSDWCNRNIMNTNAQTVSLRLGVFDDHGEVGTRPFNGASAIPLHIKIDGAAAIVVGTDLSTRFVGPVTMIKSTNAQLVGFSVDNSNSGASAYTQSEVKALNASLMLRTFPSTFTGSGGTYAATSDVVATGVGGLVLSTSSASAEVQIIGGSTSKANAKVRVNNAGVGFNGAAGGGKFVVTGSRGGNAAVASMLAGFATQGLLTDASAA